MLEYHHEPAWALGGTTSVDNIALRCRAHNALAADEDFSQCEDGREPDRCLGTTRTPIRIREKIQAGSANVSCAFTRSMTLHP